MGDEENFNGAFDDFMGIFDKVNKEEKVKLMNVFLRAARPNYKSARSEFQNRDVTLGLVGSYFHFCLGILNEDLTSLSDKDLAAKLGTVFGGLLAVFRYGLPAFLPEMDYKDENNILQCCQNINFKLKTIGKGIRMNYLRKVIGGIAKERASTLSPKRKTLLAKCAAKFAS